MSERAGRFAESVLGAVIGGLVAAATGRLVGLTVLAGLVGAANGTVSGWRGIYRWRRLSGVLAFVLDSSWSLLTTTGSLMCHIVAAAQGGGGYVAGLSRRCDRHVYVRGVRFRRGFALTIGNVVNGAGPSVASSARRRQLVTDHEHVHVWQARWFGPLFPLLYGSWTLLAGSAGFVVWLVTGRNARLVKVVETCGYYLNPFEWWAYSRGGHWPPAGKVATLGWRRPLTGSLASARAWRRFR